MRTRTERVRVLAGLLGIVLVSGVEAQDLDRGSSVFESACAHCHGVDGRGGELGPSILRRVAEEQDPELAAFLRAGSPEGGMPPAPVSGEQMRSLIGYLEFLAASAPESSAARESDAAGGRARPASEMQSYRPVTEEMLINPPAEDWLSFSRTLDAQRFSPLDQINRENVDELALAWSRGLPNGLTYTIPIVHDGSMYLTLPDASVAALDATTGDVIWRYQRDYEGGGAGIQARSKALSIFRDMVYFTAPDSVVVALDARTGEVRWEADAGGRGHTSGSIVVEGKVISAGHCIGGPRASCYISAHDAETGELVWKFHTTQGSDDPPGFDTWGGVPVSERVASPWGLPGSYDAEAGLVYWGIANPMPNTRAARHGGDADAISYSAPADLYSNSTVALDPDSGELAWYYQHLPGDDWDLDMNQERIVARTRLDPDPEHVTWINPEVERGSVRDVVVNVGEGGGLWMLDKHSGEFLWATQFPFESDNFFLSGIDVDTGRTHINEALVLDEPGERQRVCFFNTRSFWPTAYNPQRNALYVPYIRNCLDMVARKPATATTAAMPEKRTGTPQPGVALEELNGLARVDLETGEITHWPTGRIPTNSAILATAGDLIFWGDINRRYRALDAYTGAVLWETKLGGPVSVSNITYAVDNRQYLAVITGETLSQRVLTTGSMGPIPMNLDSSQGDAAIYVFALPAAD